MRDIHDYGRHLELQLASLAKSEKICSDDKQLIERFSTLLRVQKISVGRVAKYVCSLKTMSAMVGTITSGQRGLGSATRDDIERLAIQINESERYRPHTKSDFVQILKRFYQWLKAPESEYNNWRRRHRYPPEVDDLSSTMKLNQRFLPSDLLIEEEVSSIIHGAPWLMVKAVISLCDEVGPRPSELLNMKLGDIIFEEERVICRLAHNGGGKTGERMILIIKSVPILSNWIEAHPFRDDLEAPLWIGFSSTNRYEHWSYRAFCYMMADVAKRAGVKKKIIPYLFRHTAATRDARLGFTEAQLCMKYGWVLGSKMPRVYLHMANSDLYSKIEEAYGGAPAKPVESPTVKCSRCQRPNSRGLKFCGFCGTPLRREDMAHLSVELEEARQENARVANYATDVSRLKQDYDELKEMLASVLREKVG